MKKAIQSRQSQRGAGLIYWVTCIVLVGFLALFLTKVVPIYVDDRLVQTGLKSLAKSGDRLSEMSDEEIRKKLYDFYNINNVRSAGPAKGVTVDRSQADRIIVKVEYEEQVDFMMNIDLLLTFQNHLDSSLPDFCCKPRVKAE